METLQIPSHGTSGPRINRDLEQPCPLRRLCLLSTPGGPPQTVTKSCMAESQLSCSSGEMWKQEHLSLLSCHRASRRRPQSVLFLQVLLSLPTPRTACQHLQMFQRNGCRLLCGSAHWCKPGQLAGSRDAQLSWLRLILLFTFPEARKPISTTASGPQTSLPSPMILKLW